MFRAATSLAASRPVTPPIFTGATRGPNSKLHASRIFGRGHAPPAPQNSPASAEHLTRAHSRTELHGRHGAVIFPAIERPNPNLPAPGTAEQTKGNQ